MTTEDLTGMGKALTPLTEGLAKLCSKLFSESADEMGTFFAASLRERFSRSKAKNTIDVLEMADRKLTDSGIDPQPISNKLLYEFLDSASLEENETLQQLWAGLLATALQGHETHPAYPGILKALAPFEAKILNFLFLKGKHNPSAVPDVLAFSTTPLDSFLNQESFSESLLQIASENLCRLNLCTLEPKKSYEEVFEEGLKSHSFVPPNMPEFAPTTHPLSRSTPLYPELYDKMIQLSHLGYAFVKACNP
jgi:Abortive infection alpha